MLWGGLIAYALGVAALTVSEMRDSAWRFALKPLMAASFVAAILLTGGAVSSLYGHLVFLALAACALGDVLLLRKGTGAMFIAGMAAFGLGHVLYIAAFASLGLDPVHDPRPPELLILLTGFVGLILAVRLARGQPKPVRAAVAVYGFVIGIMIATAAFSNATQLVLPALAFATSDLFVAQNRFAEPKPWHPLAITPLYFGAQMAFALSPLWLA